MPLQYVKREVSEYYDLWTPTILLDRTYLRWISKAVVIVGEGLLVRSAYRQIVPDYGNRFKIYFCCRPDSRSVHNLPRTDVLGRISIPYLFRHMGLSLAANPTAFPIARSGQPYDEIRIRAGGAHLNLDRLFLGINDEQFFRDTQYALDIIIAGKKNNPIKSMELNTLIHLIQEDRAKLRRPLYEAAFVFAGRAHQQYR